MATEQELREDLASELVIARHRAGYSQSELARRLGCTPNSVWSAEHGITGGRRFWKLCDEELQMNGLFVRRFEAIRVLYIVRMAEHRRETWALKRGESMEDANDAEAATCADDCKGCASEQRLAILDGKLKARGLETMLDICDTQTTDGHYDSLVVTNPADPKRGAFLIDKDGAVTWNFPGIKPDTDDGVARLTDEAINALRATGLPRRTPGESWPAKM